MSKSLCLFLGRSVIVPEILIIIDLSWIKINIIVVDMVYRIMVL